uniref:Uncharacterized protein n=1 Tax=Odontella aurita TaxID=265563 RepID=A0A7S4I2V7_9STRA|mmetsp:Transcript_1913/g.5053  ORF Transcript_1913/g.5053 Transcript_1913/m.5053 type:complete len:228 (+) Transcript_1913:485-1168(+)
MTKIIRVVNVQFFNGKRELLYNGPFLHLEKTISINFRSQKNNEKEKIVTIHRTTGDLLNPVTHWDFTVRRIRSIPVFDNNYTVNMFPERGVVRFIISKEIKDIIKEDVRAIGKAVLGFGKKYVSTHSNHSAAAMTMYLATVPVFTIMLIGRWYSDAFLLYVHRQVQEFTTGISSRMVLNDSYFTIPDKDANIENPRTPGAHNNFAAAAQNGSNDFQHITAPNFNLFQ